MFSGLSAIAQNEYYGEDNRIHFGFSLGLNSMDFGITPSLVETNDGKIYQVDVFAFETRIFGGHHRRYAAESLFQSAFYAHTSFW